LQENWLLLLPSVLGFIGIYFLLPKARRLSPLWGGGLAVLALVLGAIVFIRTGVGTVESILFYSFSGLAVLSGGMMITQKNPVHAALSFALVVLSTCGLFLLQAAPFLMAATIIIYAGAIVVTFLFVIMLAQQEGPSNADSRSREPFLASLAGCVLLASLVCILIKTYDTRDLDGILRDLAALKNAKDENDVKRILGDPAKADASELIAQLKKHSDDPDIDNLGRLWVRMRIDPRKNLEPLKEKATVLEERMKRIRDGHGTLALTNVPGKANTPGHMKAPGTLPASNVAAIGKTLFTDYLIPVELAATLLLVATIGAIAIAGRKTEELR
jgi:NADH:ubiquinone oxidoreductase subunit 6 (subunit J)